MPPGIVISMLALVAMRERAVTGRLIIPWTPVEAERHAHKATTPELKELWAKVANERLENTGVRAIPAAAVQQRRDEAA
jgi:hypothetical protein